jgi:hypothetical protein
MQPIGIGPRLFNAGAADLLGITKPLGVGLGKSGMGQIEMADRPSRWISVDVGIVRRLSEKGQLVAEGPPIFRDKMAGVVPPFRTKFIVRSMVAWKVELIVADRLAKT